MKRKIIAIFVIGIFLLQCISIVSAVKINEASGNGSEEPANNEALPDLKIKAIYKINFFDDLWEIKFYISNIGEKKVDAGEYIIIKSNGWLCNDPGYIIDVFQIGESLDPDKCWTSPEMKVSRAFQFTSAEVDPTSWDCEPRFRNCDPVNLDPDPEYGLVDESNEENNAGQYQFSRTVTRGRLLHNFGLFSWLPKILGLLPFN